MLRMQVPNTFFDTFDGQHNYDPWFAHSRLCRSNSWSNGCKPKSPLSKQLRQPVRPQMKAKLSNFHRRNAQPQFKVEPMLRTAEPKQIQPELFKANFALDSFEPSEIRVKLQDKSLVVEAKHEHESDGHYEHHQYIKKVPFPDNVLTDQIKCILDQLGHLHIEAPVNEHNKSEHSIQIEQCTPQIESMESNSEVVIEDIGPE